MKRFVDVLLLASLLLPSRARAADDPPTTKRSEVAGGPCERAVARRAIAEYHEAASLSERCAVEKAGTDEARVALTDALLLRIALGQRDKAREDAAALVRAFGASHPAEVADVILVLAMDHAERERWKESREVLASHAALFERAPRDLRIRARVLFARTFARGGERDGAARASAEYAKARALWDEEPLREEHVRKAWPRLDEMAALRKLGRALDAIGEARFAAAEEQRKRTVDSIAPPVAVPAPSKAHLDALAEWATKRRRAIEAVQPAYVRVLEIEPMPPPRWVVAAAASHAQMWTAIVETLDKAAPAEPSRAGSRARARRTDVERPSDAIRVTSARSALVHCVALSAKFQFSSEASETCVRALERHFPDEHFRVDELAPAVVAAQPRAPASPLTYDGVPWRPR